MKKSAKPAKPAKSTKPAKRAPLAIPPVLPIVCRVLDEKKAGDVRVLHVGDKSSITDYLVIATGTSEPHLRALRVELEKAIDSSGVRIVGMDTGQPRSGWIVVDTFDVMIHVFTQETRRRYSLEKLWSDAKEIPLSEFSGRAKPPAPPVKKRKKPAPPLKPGRRKAA
jgi:ribosome-associated protein